MGKILMVSFENDEEPILDAILRIMQENGNFEKLGILYGSQTIEYETLIINPKTRMVQVEKQEIELTNYEFEILYLLARHPGQVFSKEQIYNQVWKEPYYRAEDNVMSLIRRIRKKIEPDPSKPIYILTVWGIGYKFNNAMKK